MRQTIFCILLIIPQVSFSEGKTEVKQGFKDTKKVQQTFGENSDIKNLGDKIANIKIDNRENINMILTKNIKTNIKNKINTLIIPKIVGFSELRYNKVNNNFTMISHSKKTKKIYTLNLSKKNFNYIKITNNNQKIQNNHILNKITKRTDKSIHITKTDKSKTTIVDNRIDNSLTNHGVIFIDNSENNISNFSPKLNFKF